MRRTVPLTTSWARTSCGSCTLRTYSADPLMRPHQLSSKLACRFGVVAFTVRYQTRDLRSEIVSSPSARTIPFHKSGGEVVHCKGGLSDARVHVRRNPEHIQRYRVEESGLHVTSFDRTHSSQWSSEIRPREGWLTRTRGNSRL